MKSVKFLLEVETIPMIVLKRYYNDKSNKHYLAYHKFIFNFYIKSILKNYK